MSIETVTPVKFRASDGIVYERTGEKREPKTGELHWCEATRPAPYPFEWPSETQWTPREDWPPAGCQTESALTLEGGTDPMYRDPEDRPCIHCGTARRQHSGPNSIPNPICPQFHKCAIWKVSDDQAWQPPAPLSTEGENPIDRLIQRLHLAGGGDIDGGNIPVLAMLYQAKALEQLAAMSKYLGQIGNEELQAIYRLLGSIEKTERVPMAALIYTLAAYLIGICTALVFHIKP